MQPRKPKRSIVHQKHTLSPSLSDILGGRPTPKWPREMKANTSSELVNSTRPLYNTAKPTWIKEKRNMKRMHWLLRLTRWNCKLLNLVMPATILHENMNRECARELPRSQQNVIPTLHKVSNQCKEVPASYPFESETSDLVPSPKTVLIRWNGFVSTTAIWWYAALDLAMCSSNLPPCRSKLLT